uniref:Uncharacterized protein n=1 Tax=Panagrolaimus sp. ES5 TaxID=591445 RepID=A0AC34G1T5_9BILA
MFFFSIFFLFLLFITVANSRPNNYYLTNNETSSNDLLSDLSADSSNPSVSQISDDKVELIKFGDPVDLVLFDESLDVEIDLHNCDGRCPSNFCEFRVEGKRDKIDFITAKNILKIALDPTCDSIQLKRGITSYCGQRDLSCEPWLIDNDKKIRIIVKAKRSKIYVEPITTTSLPTTKNSPAVSNASTGWYIWIIIVVGILLFVIGVIIGIVICWKKRLCIFKKDAEVKKKITFTDTANSTIITKEEDALKTDLPKPPPPPKPTLKTSGEVPPPASKVAKKSKKKSEKKSKKSGKVKKEKKDVKKDTVDDAQTPTSAPPPSFIPVKSYIPPPLRLAQEQVLEEDYYFRKPNKERLRNSKSLSKSNSSKTSFVRQIERKTPKARLEPHYSSMKRNGIIMTEKCKELERHYKVDTVKKPLDVEISLLTDYIGDIFATINRLIERSQTVLKEYGAEFDENGKAKEYPSAVFDYLSDSETPEYIRFVAMASEVGHIIPVEDDQLKQYSISLLLLIGFTKSILEPKRRHALAILRRKLPKIRATSTVEERNAFGYPANAIELAFQRDSRCFDHLKSIKTDSTVNLSEVTQE